MLQRDTGHQGEQDDRDNHIGGPNTFLRCKKGWSGHLHHCHFRTQMGGSEVLIGIHILWSRSNREAEDHIFGVCVFNDWSARIIIPYNLQETKNIYCREILPLKIWTICESGFPVYFCKPCFSCATNAGILISIRSLQILILLNPYKISSFFNPPLKYITLRHI